MEETAFGSIEVESAATKGTSTHHLTMAGGDTLARAHQWWTPLGEATAALRGDDFADTDQESFAVATSPRLALRAQRLADIVRFNRVEGWSTGATAEFTPGVAAPNVSLRANATWAWTERTVRGRIEATRRGESGDWRIGLRAGRSLDITNDFTAPSDSGGALLSALAGVDDYDYVDRTSTTLWYDRNIIPRVATIRMELGAATDRGAHARLARGLFGGVAPFRPNRGVDAGSYVRSAFVAEWNPAVNAATMTTGVGAILRSDLAAGALDWHRSTLRVNARADAGPMAYALRLDGGLLTSRHAPAQQLFELGGGRAFPGYDYKEFAGDRALAAHARALYRLPVLRAPLTVMGCTCLTSPAPALAVTLHAASLSSSSAATQASVSRLGSASDSVAFTLAPLGPGVPISRSTGHVRSSIEVGLRFFGGAASVALARPLDTRGPWHTIIALGQAW